MRAPKVNQMRFFSSSALAMAPKLIFAASCSAAEAIMVSPKYLVRDSHHANGGRAIITRAAAWILVNVGAGSRLRNGTQQGDRATSLLDRFDGRLGRAVDLERQLRLKLTDAEDLPAVPRLGDYTGSHQRLDSDGSARIELAGLDGLLNAPDIDLVEVDRVRLVEAALRQTTVQRHLTAFEALDRHAGAGLLTLHATAAGLALAGADTTTDTHAVLGRTFVVTNFVEFHDALLTARRQRARGA